MLEIRIRAKSEQAGFFLFSRFTFVYMHVTSTLVEAKRNSHIGALCSRSESEEKKLAAYNYVISGKLSTDHRPHQVQNPSSSVHFVPDEDGDPSKACQK